MAKDDLVDSLRRAFALRGTSVSEDEVLGVALERLRRTARSYLRFKGGKTPSYETDDLMVDAAVILFGKEPQFESAKHFENWAWQVAIRLHASHWQRKYRKKRPGGYDHTSIADVDPADPSAVLDVDLVALRAALEELEETDSALSSVITHRFLFGYSEKETADLLGMSVRTVRRRARAAKAWLGNRI